MKKFDIPEIPRELMLRATRKAFDIYDGTALEQNDPAITLHWDDPDYMDYLAAADPKRMVEDPEYDLETQLKNIRYRIKMLEAGSTGVGSYPVLNLVHFGTGPIATAFGARMVMQTGIQPHFDPAFHTAEEALHTEMGRLAGCDSGPDRILQRGDAGENPHCGQRQCRAVEHRHLRLAL